MAFLLAAWLLFVARTPQTRQWLGLWSAMLLFATALGTYGYVSQDWVWNILRNNYPIWTYPILNAFIAIYLFCYIAPQIPSPSEE